MTEIEKELIYSTFKYDVGDVLKIADPDKRLLLPTDLQKEYHDNLRVVFRFFDGNHLYIIETEDGYCLILKEEEAELVEKAKAQEPKPKKEDNIENESVKDPYYLGYVYKVNKKLVVSDSIENAIRLFRKHPSHQADTIESINLIEKDCAIVQSKIGA
jgi:hypothetical protein